MRRIWPVLAALIPFLLLLLVSLGLQMMLDPLPVLVFRADIGTIILVTGAVLSLIGLAWAAASMRARRYTDRAVAEERSEQDRAHRRFLRRLDHELKNPLTGIRAALANINRDTPPGEQERFVQDARLQAERLSRLVNDLRKLAELEERPLESFEVNVTDLLNEVVENLSSHPRYAGRSVHLVISNVPWPLPAVMGDRDLLGLVFYNLVENALKFTGLEDPVEVRAREENQAVVVEVADTGPGIPQEDMDRIFEELYRGANARGFEGSGLGLPLVQRVVARHDGSVGVRSRQDGKGGTVFSVLLPAKR